MLRAHPQVIAESWTLSPQRNFYDYVLISMYIFYAKEAQTTPMKRSSEEVHTIPPKWKRLMTTPV